MTRYTVGFDLTFPGGNLFIEADSPHHARQLATAVLEGANLQTSEECEALEVDWTITELSAWADEPPANTVEVCV